MTAKEFIAQKRHQLENGDLSSTHGIIGSDKKIIFKIEAITFLIEEHYKEKVFVFERLRNKDDMRYRIGYFIVGKTGARNGKWTWGQYCPVFTSKDLNKLLQLAKEEGTLIP